MMKKTRNAGFSLVELIVVVLIMAIVAVALAPQVMKWVENSRVASDLDMRANIENACILAITEQDAFARVKDGGYEIIIRKDSSGNVTHKYKVNRGGSVSGELDRDDIDVTDPFWIKFIEVGNYGTFENFENATLIKSTPMDGNGIELVVHVYEGGYTFSELDGVRTGDLGTT